MIQKHLVILFPISLLFLIAIFSFAGEQESTQALSNSIYKDLLWQKKKPDFYKHRPSEDKIDSLKNAHKCPHDGSSLVILKLPAARSYSDISKSAYYCEKETIYWVAQTHGTFKGTRSGWNGPFKLESHN